MTREYVAVCYVADGTIADIFAARTLAAVSALVRECAQANGSYARVRYERGEERC
jgi:hypothetical protein